MVLTVTSYGLRLKRAGDCILAVEKGGTERRIPISQVEELVLAAPCSLSSDVIALCMKNKVPVTGLGDYGNPVWYTEAFEGGGAPLLHRKQLRLAESPDSSVLVKTLLTKKLEARVAFLRRLAGNRRDERGDALRKSGEKAETFIAKINALPRLPIDRLRETLQGYEGTAGKIYFAALADILPAEAAFTGRDRGPAAGPFNHLLNYGYGILYRELLQLCFSARLDPYIGVMHTDAYNKPTLTYDLIEPFRASVEETVCKLFTKRQVNVGVHFCSAQGGLTLSPEGKKLLTENICGGKKQGYRTEMEKLVRGLAKGLEEWKE